MSIPEAKPERPQNRLKIAVLNRNFSPTGGGAERYSIALVEQLAARHEIHVFAQQIDHGWPGVTYHPVSQLLKRPRWINQLWYATATWWATRHGFDVVHSHENTWHGQVQTVHVLPIAHNLFDGLISARLGWRWFKVLTSPRLLTYLWLEHLRYSTRPGRILVVTSPSARRALEQTHPESAPMIRMVAPGVAVVPGKTTALDRQRARQLLGLPQGPLCILFVGNDYRKKGLTALLDAVARLPDDVILAVVGNPDHEAGFKPQISALGLDKKVFFLGSLGDINPAYQAVDCLAHPTLEDTFAMVVLEAMAHALPVVVSAQPYCGIAGLLDDGVNALLLGNPRDVTALAGHLGRLLQDAPLRDRLGQAAVDFARLHQWESIAMEQDAIYQATQ